MEIAVGEVIKWGEECRLGVISKIRLIDSAKFVEKFSGDPQTVHLVIESAMGAASVWAKNVRIEKTNDHEAKEFKSLVIKKHPKT